MINAEKGFTSDVIKDPSRFVGRSDQIRDCIKAVNTELGLIAIYGKRGVGKSSLLRQVQQMALGDYTLAKKAGLSHEIPSRPRRYLTCFYTCDSFLKDGAHLLQRLCDDQNEEDGLLRLVPDEGKELVEFERSKEVEGGVDLRLVNWGVKGVETSRYAKKIEGDVIQTFRNYVSAIITHQVKKKMKRDGLLILLDEFDVLQNKSGLGSLIKSLSSKEIKFAISGIARDLNDMVEDHASIERLLEEGSINVKAMSDFETQQIFFTAEKLFNDEITFDRKVVSEIAKASGGYPYLAQLIGKECVNTANRNSKTRVDLETYTDVLKDIAEGRAFPTLRSAYERTIGESRDRQILLHFLAEQDDATDLSESNTGQVLLKRLRSDARDLNIEWVDQLIPRLVDKKFGPVLYRLPERQGSYEFVNPVLRLYIKLRNF